MECLTYVLAHEQLGADRSKLASEDGDLFGGNVVNVDEQNLAVLAAVLLQSVPLLDLLSLCLLCARFLWHLPDLIQ